MKKPSFQKRTHQVFSQDRYVYQLRINLIMTKKEIRFLYITNIQKIFQKKKLFQPFFCHIHVFLKLFKTNVITIVFPGC